MHAPMRCGCDSKIAPLAEVEVDVDILPVRSSEPTGSEIGEFLGPCKAECLVGHVEALEFESCRAEGMRQMALGSGADLPVSTEGASVASGFFASLPTPLG